MRKYLLLLMILTGAQTYAIEPESFSPARYADAKVIYLDFWASWCVPCRKSFPWLNRMQAKYDDRGLRVVGINLDHKRAEARAFLEHYAADFDLVFDPEGTLAERWNLKGMPSAVLVTPGGEVLARHIGFRADRKHAYETQIQRLLEEQK